MTALTFNIGRKLIRAQIILRIDWIVWFPVLNRTEGPVTPSKEQFCLEITDIVVFRKKLLKFLHRVVATDVGYCEENKRTAKDTLPTTVSHHLKKGVLVRSENVKS